jgi:hypothetical protein
MLRDIRRKIALGLGIVTVSLLAVACAGATQFSSTTGGIQASVGGFSVRLPGVVLPFVSAAPKPATAQTTTTIQSSIQDVTYSGEGCPIALPQ